MATATLHSLRDRMTPPATSRQDAAAREDGPRIRRTEIDRLLHLATDLFGVGAAVLVLVAPEGLRVEPLSAACRSGAEGALDAARRLFEILAASDSSGSEFPRHAAGVMEEVAPGSGFMAAAPIVSADGRCRGAICLMDPDRKTLLTGLQRRLFAEFGTLVAPSVEDAPDCDAGPAGPAASGESAALLRDLADREPDAVALFDPDGRCLLRNRQFDALLGLSRGVAAWPAIAAARGREAGWLALHIGRDVEPLALYRAVLADGSRLCVEERRGPQGGSLVARLEARHALGGSVERAA